MVNINLSGTLFAVSAILTAIPTLVVLICFASVLWLENVEISTLPTAASVIGTVSLLLITTLLGYQLKVRPCQTKEDGSKIWNVILGIACFLCTISSVVTLVTLAWLQGHCRDLPSTIVRAPKQALLTASFVLWGISSLLQALFFLCTHRVAAQRSIPLHVDEERRIQSEKQVVVSQSALSQVPVSANRSSTLCQVSKHSVSDTKSSFSSNSRKRSASDAMDSLSSHSCKRFTSETVSSMRSSITHVIRPTSSKARLTSQRLSSRRTSLDSGTGEREIVDEGFDSWDMSAVDPQSREFFPSTANSLTTSNPSASRCLETIPASPTGSRSPSPGCPLDLQPPQRRRARSYSPATSARDTRLRDVPKYLQGKESHIHPLFRTDSPTPPPSATPGTIVTVAPGAGTVVVDRRTVHRIRSGSLRDSQSPLGFSKSMDDISKRTEEDEEDGNRSPSPPEREMTPPIPEWVMGAGPRNSMNGYSRRKLLAGLGPVGEVKEG